jgi:membrane-associated phospholipid phosphatase
MVRMAYHWVSDVVGGWLLGMIILLAVLAAADVLAHRSALTERGDLVRGEPGRGEHGAGVRARARRR